MEQSAVYGTTAAATASAPAAAAPSALPRTLPSRAWLAFGPAALVTVGYMDPGNWATDLAAGSGHGYLLLSVILLASLMAMPLQVLSARLGIGSGKDLATCCREQYSRPVS